MMQRMKSRDCGFTLMELMVTLSIAGIVIAIGTPSFREFSRNNRMVAVANDFLGGVQTARTEAIKRQLLTGGVSICPTDAPSDPNATCLGAGTTRFDGWIMFTDENNDCERDGADKILRTGARIDQQNSAARFVKSKSDGVCVSFGSGGFTHIIAGRPSASHIVFCDERGLALQTGTNLSTVRGIEITNTGRARITRDQAEITTWNVGCAQ